MENSLGVYIHIPFCRAKCGYCDFNSYALLEHMIPAYVRALTGEIKSRADPLSPGNPPAATIYFGGGTPSLLQPDHIASILEA
ncbi:MAG: coproporphyrinogen III oxidase family protein, partial [Dehalococcoidia bacterium]|nr:coproporphyrinogen III oxidase family protein [Dehalococcoidia bacterium]